MDGERVQRLGAPGLPDVVAAPPVVAVVVVHTPGPWFDETLASLARQDYPALDTVFLVTGAGDRDADDVADHIHAVLPNAFVEEVAGNPGFGPAANSRRCSSSRATTGSSASATTTLPSTPTPSA